MLTKRLIACLDVRNGRVVKGIQFEDLRDAGDPAEQAARYARDGIDEIVMLDVTATIERRKSRIAVVRAVSNQIFIPLTIGGGIACLDDARAVLEAGADKVSLNSGAIRNPDAITAIANCYGSQAVVVAVDARRVADGRYRVFSRGGAVAEPREAASWAREAEARGAGEILLTSIDRDGTRSGFDCKLTAAVSDAVGIPVIASGGAGTAAHFVDVFGRGRADAALAASVFHFSTAGVSALKRHLALAGIPVRLES